MTQDRLFRALKLPLLLIFGALVLTGCGRRGALEPPPGTAIAQEEDAKPATDQRPSDRNPNARDRKFILDGLLQ